MINFTQDITPNYPVHNDIFISFQPEFLENDRSVININNGDFLFTIYPSNDGKYLFNLKSVAKSFFNNKFKDLVDMNGNNFFLPDYNLLKEISIEITCYDGEGNEETIEKTYTFNQSVKQYGDRNFTNTNQLLLPSKDGINYQLKYFEGYPIDIAFNYLNVGDEVLITNDRTEETIEFSVEENSGYRLYLDKGFAGLPMNMPDMGNPLQIAINSDNVISIDVRKIASKCGVYLKWLNTEGAYSYWLFDKFFNETIEASEIDRVTTNNFSNIYSNSEGQSIITGKEAGKEMTIKTLVDENDYQHLKSLMTSPFVQLWSEQKPFQVGQWLNIKVTNRNIQYSNKRGKNKVSLDIELPEVQTQKL